MRKLLGNLIYLSLLLSVTYLFASIVVSVASSEEIFDRRELLSVCFDKNFPVLGNLPKEVQAQLMTNVKFHCIEEVSKQVIEHCLSTKDYHSEQCREFFNFSIPEAIEESLRSFQQ